MPCHAMLCHARLNFALASPKSSFFDVNTPVCFNVVSSLDRGRTRAAATSRDGHYPPPTDIARALVPGPEVLRHGCCTSCRHQRDEGFASSSCWWALANHKKRESGADGGLFRAFRLCCCSCACTCANLIVDILASGPWTASALHLRWTFRAACRIRIMCTVALRTMYAQEHAALADCRLRTRPCMSRQSQFNEGRMCPYPDVPALCEDLARARRRSSTEQGHWARTSLERALRKYPQ